MLCSPFSEVSQKKLDRNAKHINKIRNRRKQDIEKHTFMDIGIMIEHKSSNRSGMISSSYHGPSIGYLTYHCCTRQEIGISCYYFYARLPKLKILEMVSQILILSYKEVF